MERLTDQEMTTIKKIARLTDPKRKVHGTGEAPGSVGTPKVVRGGVGCG